MILVTSVSSWNQSSGSDTLSSLLKGFDCSDIANIYIRDGIPDSPVAGRYFMIDEMAVMKSCFKRNIQTGKEVNTETKAVPQKTLLKSVYHHRNRLFLWARELGWKLGKWNGRELNEYIDSVNAEVLLFPIESYPYFNRINEYIIKRCHPKIVIGCLWDDNFTYKQHPYNFIFKIERFFLRKQVKRLVASCTDVLAICPKMKEECDKEFGINSILLTKPVFNLGEFQAYRASYPIKILYTGKLIIGRERSAIKVVEAIKEVNKDSQKVILDIYTDTILPEKIKKKIAVEGNCNIHPPVPQSEVTALQRNADVLLFMEALSDKNLTARLSFSTKLTDYLAAGKCIWAVGNIGLGPISYVEREDAGLVSIDEMSIQSELSKIISSPDVILEYAKKGYECGMRNHDGKMIIEKLRNIIDR